MKRITFTIFLIALAAIFTTTKAQTPDEMKKWMDYMTPTDVHKMLGESDGEWDMEIQMWMDPDAPAQYMKASCVNKMILGGRYQQSINTGSFNGMPFEGHSLTGWDNARKIFVSTWVDNMGTGIMYMEGPWNEAEKTVDMKGKMTDPMTGEIVDVRQTLKIVDNNTQVMQQFGVKNGKEFKNMEIKFTRKK